MPEDSGSGDANLCIVSPEDCACRVDAPVAPHLGGMIVHWRRQVSPAPASDNFADVTTGHWAFRHIEALAASGITVGCGGGDFCPEDPLTRAQMAVFLGKALGLHYAP